LIGLGYSTTPNIFDSAFAAGQISSAVFAIQLSEFDSLLYFNGIPDNISNATKFVPQYLTGHWVERI